MAKGKGKQGRTEEAKRLRASAARTANWKRWGPYLAERQWGTVREDYSSDGSAWTYLPHDHARSVAYRWGDDGLLGITDRQCRMCFAVALWNGNDPILKERLYGLTGPEGNHGEDVKECYYYLDSSPTHAYMKALYKYPQAAFPYEQLVRENARRSRGEPEYELTDTGIFDDNRYFDVQVEYAKRSPNDVLVRITISNRGPDDATLHVLPTLWYRNTWMWGCEHEGCWLKPQMQQINAGHVRCEHMSLGTFEAAFAPVPGSRTAPPLLFTDNHTNTQRLYGQENHPPYVKDAFDRYVIHGEEDAVNPKNVGTKVAAHYTLTIPAGESVVLQARFADAEEKPQRWFGAGFDKVFDTRLAETDEFYSCLLAKNCTDEQRMVERQAYGGLLWSKQFYHYIVKDWLDGDPSMPPPADSRKQGRNADWTHLFNRDVISMPDKWEYPWYAAWDLAFHAIAFAAVDPDFAKKQLILLLREWYMHPSGEIPAYEFALSDVNPPVHAWACWRVYKMTGPRGKRDRLFLERVFHKLLINFTWWVNRKDLDGRNLFSGGFLGLDNIGVFDRSRPLPDGDTLDQADATAWMGFYCLTMLSMALELAKENPAYEDVASKFFEHFISIVDAMNSLGGTGLWDEQDGFYYDTLKSHRPDSKPTPLRIRSLVGLIPLIAVEVLETDVVESLPGFYDRTGWFIRHRQDLSRHISYMESKGNRKSNGHMLLAIPSHDRLERVLQYMLDETEFLSPYGVRSMSRFHDDQPFRLDMAGQSHTVRYTPAESDSDLFGGNSNWRGPVWFPINYLLIESLQRYHYFYGDSFTVEMPTGSGHRVTLEKAAEELSRRMTLLFLKDSKGGRPCHGDEARYRDDPHWRDLVLFYEYFDGNNGRGCGASHQTGWTAIVTRLLGSGRHTYVDQ